MIGKIIKNYLEQSNEDKEVEVILYGMKILGTSILTAMVIIILGIITGQAVSAIIYLSILILLRRNMGGYHSKTYVGCILITSLNFLLIVFMKGLLYEGVREILGIIFLIFSTVRIYKSKPSVHKNRIVNKDTIEKSNIKKNKSLSIIVFIATMCYIFQLIGLIEKCNYFVDISISLIIVALSIKNRKGDEIYEQSFS